MPNIAPDPDQVTPEGTALWRCPHCDQLKPIEEYGWRKRDDIYPGQDVYHKQSWCNACRALP
jgi:hypothetical protein